MWAIAKKLVQKESKVNLASNLLRRNRQIKQMKLQDQKNRLLSEFGAMMKTKVDKKRKKKSGYFNDDEYDDEEEPSAA